MSTTQRDNNFVQGAASCIRGAYPPDYEVRKGQWAGGATPVRLAKVKGKGKGAPGEQLDATRGLAIDEERKRTWRSPPGTTKPLVLLTP